MNAANSAGSLNELIRRRLKTKGECTHGYLRTIWIEFRYAEYLMRLKSTSAQLVTATPAKHAAPKVSNLGFGIFDPCRLCLV